MSPGSTALGVLILGASQLALAGNPKISPQLAARAKAGGQVEVLIEPTGRADLGGLTLFVDKSARGKEVMARLRRVADASQQGVRKWLDARGIEHRDFWIVNAIWARMPANALEELAARDDVTLIAADSRVHHRLPQPEPVAKAATAIEWGVSKVRAPEIWALGYNGQGVVVAGADTGYQWDHPALKAKYRGWDGATASHAYHWHDAIHGQIGGTPNSCGYNLTAPCDDYGHGTHTMGTMVGADGANQIGVAPGAKWIACRNMDQGTGAPSTYIECFQWFLAPTDASNANPDPNFAPHVINNSWGCTSGEGCDAAGSALVGDAVNATIAAGILVVVSAGNSGPACATIYDPPAYFDAALSIGATNSADAIAGFSSRGPVTADGSNRVKPDVVAPGVAVRSSVPINGYASYQGTSMAGPHAVGVAALLMSEASGLRGDPAAVAAAIKGGAVPLTSTQDCGTYPGAQVPNAVFGQGRIDVMRSRDFLGLLLDDGYE